MRGKRRRSIIRSVTPSSVHNAQLIPRISGFLADGFVRRVVQIDIFQVERTCFRISFPRGDGEVQIRIVVGTANDRIMVFDGVSEREVFVAPVVPPLDNGIVRQRVAVMIDYVAPEDGFPSFRLQIVCHLRREP